jgi:hypothetical protein
VERGLDDYVVELDGSGLERINYNQFLYLQALIQQGGRGPVSFGSIAGLEDVKKIARVRDRLPAFVSKYIKSVTGKGSWLDERCGSADPQNVL